MSKYNMKAFNFVKDILYCLTGAIVGSYLSLLLTAANVFVLSLVNSARIFDGIFGLGFIALGMLMFSKIIKKTKKASLTEEMRKFNELGKEDQKMPDIKALFDEFKFIQPTALGDSPILSKSLNEKISDAT